MSRGFYIYFDKKSGAYMAEILDPQTGARVCKRNTGVKGTGLKGDKARDAALLIAAGWVREGIPERKRGKVPVYQKPAAHKVNALIGLQAILKGIEQTTDLDEDQALEIARALRDRGLLSLPIVKAGPGNVDFCQFLDGFWSYDTSEYIQDKIAHGHRFSRRHAYECKLKVKTELLPFFGDKKLHHVTTDDLSILSRQLADRGLATSTINQIVLVCKTPLKWAFNKKMIPENPCVGLSRFSITNRERGVLTGEEAAAVFAVDWKDKRAFVASLFAATSGARQGECLALRQSDIGKDTITIAHSYSALDGLKLPKNNHKRIVPLLPEVRAALMDLIKDNPWDSENNDPFIFYSSLPDRPVDPHVILKGLKDALDLINVDHKGRNVTFHSWRHFFCSRITQQIEGEKVAKVSGHLSEAVFKKYADHIEEKNIHEVGAAAAQVFENILQFKKAV